MHLLSTLPKTGHRSCDQVTTVYKYTVVRDMHRAIFLVITVGLCVSENIPQSDVFVRSAQDDDFYSQDVGDAEKLRVIIGDSSGWVNPHNMFSYDPGSQLNRKNEPREVISETDEPISEDTVTSEERKVLRSKKTWTSPTLLRTKPPPPSEVDEEHHPEPTQSCDPCDCNCGELKRYLQKCQNDLQAVRLRAVLADVETSKSSSTGCSRDRQFVYLRRLALSIVYNAKFRRRNIQSNIMLSILLSPEEISALEQLAKQPESRAEELESRLSSILASSTVVPDTPTNTGVMATIAVLCANVFGQPRAEWVIPGLALLGVLLFAALRGASWRVVFLALVVYLLFASFLWHWVHIYKVTEAHREAYLNQNVEAASVCTPAYAPGILSGILDLFTWKRVDCQQYYEEIHVHPLWRNSPMMVLSETVWRSILHPLLFAGKYIGRFMADFCSQLRWWSILPATVFLLCIIPVLVALCLGYAVVLPCGMGSLKPLGATLRPQVKVTDGTQDPAAVTNEAATRRVEFGQGDCRTPELPQQTEFDEDNGEKKNFVPQATEQSSFSNSDETKNVVPPAVAAQAAATRYVDEVSEDEASEEEEGDET